MRTKELVGRAGQEVAAQLPHVNRAVRRILHGVDIAECARLSRPANDRRDVVDRSGGVRGVAHGHHLRAWTNLGAQVVHVERAGLGQDARDADDGATFLGQRQPGVHVGGVVERRHHDLVARRQGAANGTAQREGQCGHVGTEDDLARIGGVQEVGCRGVGAVECGVGPRAREEGAVGVGVLRAQIVDDAVDAVLRDLRAARIVQIDDGTSALLHRQRREVRADGGGVERRGGRGGRGHGGGSRRRGDGRAVGHRKAPSSRRVTPQRDGPAGRPGESARPSLYGIWRVAGLRRVSILQVLPPGSRVWSVADERDYPIRLVAWPFPRPTKRGCTRRCSACIPVKLRVGLRSGRLVTRPGWPWRSPGPCRRRRPSGPCWP